MTEKWWSIWIYLTHISHVKSVTWKLSTCKRLTFRLTPPPAPKQRRNVPGGRAPYPEMCSNDLIVWWFCQINLWYLMLLSSSKQCRSKSWVSALCKSCFNCIVIYIMKFLPKPNLYNTNVPTIRICLLSSKLKGLGCHAAIFTAKLQRPWHLM